MMPAAQKAMRPAAAALLAALPSPAVHHEHLAAVLDLTTLRRLGPGNALCTEGEPGEELYFLLEGSIRVQRRDPQGRMRELATIEAPALVGHMAVIDGSARSASCVSEGHALVAVLDRRTHQSLVGEATPRGAALRRILLSSLTQQLTGGNERIRHLMEAAAGPADEEDAAHAVLGIANVLEGWSVDARGVDRAAVVPDALGPRGKSPR